MSRAFVNQDSLVADVPDRPVSPHPNYVTRDGLAQIETALSTAQRLYGEAQASGNREALMKAARELRYWDSRRASAQLVDSPPNPDTVQFGCTVSFQRDGGRRQTFRIVGEDEADPKKGTTSHASPLARALIGKSIGDAVLAGADRAEITEIQ